jgi:8-oxo-dGTP diphosphatase
MRVIGAAVVGPRGLLLVAKRAAPEIYYLPGGKPEADEAPVDCLRREIAEELGVEIDTAEPFTEVHAPAALEGVEMWMSVFLTRLNGTPRPAAEIAGMRWWPESPVRLAPAVRDQVIPRLRAAGLLSILPV